MGAWNPNWERLHDEEDCTDTGPIFFRYYGNTMVLVCVYFKEFDGPIDRYARRLLRNI